MDREFSQNFWKIISQFFVKTPINARFFVVSSQFTYCSHFWILSQSFPNTVFRTFSNIFKISSNFYAISPRLEFLKTQSRNFSEKIHIFSTVSIKVVSRFVRKIHQVTIKIFLECVQRFLKIFPMIFLRGYFLNFLKIFHSL